MRNAAEGAGALVGVLFLFAQFIFWGGTSMGVVREHCLDAESSSAASAVDTDSGWTYIIWPPFTAANLDPSGLCVRNSPLREALGALGIWELESPEDQVREHVQEQLRDR